MQNHFMLNRIHSRDIIALKIILDCDSEIRAINFHGTRETGKTYITLELVFIRAAGRQNSFFISFPVNQITQIRDYLTHIRNEMMND